MPSYPSLPCDLNFLGCGESYKRIDPGGTDQEGSVAVPIRVPAAQYCFREENPWPTRARWGGGAW
jgi:hypothetical protein